MSKKLVPGMLFNGKDFRYPQGKKILDIDQYTEMLDSGEWSDGPGLPSGKPKKKHLSQMNTPELVEEAKGLGIEINEEWKKADLLKAIREKKE